MAAEAVGKPSRSMNAFGLRFEAPHQFIVLRLRAHLAVFPHPVAIEAGRGSRRAKDQVSMRIELDRIGLTQLHQKERRLFARLDRQRRNLHDILPAQRGRSRNPRENYDRQSRELNHGHSSKLKLSHFFRHTLDLGAQV